jgi:hypothetical protein
LSSPEAFRANGLRIRSGLLFDANEQITSADLARSWQALPDLRLPSGSTVSFYPGGDLFFFRTSSPVTFRGLTLAQGRAACFYPDREVILELGVDSVVERHALPAHTSVVLDPQYHLRRAWLSKATSLDGMKFWNPPRTVVTFHPNGRLRSGRLAGPETIGGVSVRGEEIELFPDGTLRSGTLDRDQVIAGVPCMAGQRIERARNGLPVHVEDKTYTFEILKGQELTNMLDGALQKALSDLVKGLSQSTQKLDFSVAKGSESLSVHLVIRAFKLVLDCDCDLTFDPTYSWSVTHSYSFSNASGGPEWRASFTPWCSHVGFGVSCNPGCVGLRMATGFLDALGVLEPILRIGAQRVFAIEKYSPIIADLSKTVNHAVDATRDGISGRPGVIADSFNLVSVLIENDALKITYALKCNTGAQADFGPCAK